MKRLLYSEESLRAGWSLALFFGLYATMTLGAQFAFATIPVLRDWSARQPRGVIAPLENIAFTGLELLILTAAVALTGQAEKRSLGDYGLPTTGVRVARLLPGMVFGFGMASILIGLIAMAGGFGIRGVAIRGMAIFQNSILYGVGFLLVGFFEEFAFRGYLQATLGRGIGRRTAAVVLSLAFGAMHLGHYRGAWAAVPAAACFGLLGVYSVYRTGSLWFFIGAHAAFDWSIAFFYSTSIAGIPAEVHLLNVSLHGPRWLTGGPSGPVASVMAFAAFGLAAVAIHFLFPRIEPKATLSV